VHPHKGAVEDTRQRTAIGYLVDTSARRLLLPATREAKMMRAAVSLLAESASNRRWVGGRRLRRFCGLAMSSALAVPIARFHLRRLHQCIGSTQPCWDARLPEDARHDLARWASLGAPGQIDRFLWQEVVRVELTTEACLSGWGVVLDRCLPARGLFGPESSAELINLKELVAVRMAIESFPGAIARGGLIRVRCDNTVVVAVVNAMVSRSVPRMVALLRAVSLSSRLCCRLEASWLPARRMCGPTSSRGIGTRRIGVSNAPSSSRWTRRGARALSTVLRRRARRTSPVSTPRPRIRAPRRSTAGSSIGGGASETSSALPSPKRRL